MQGSPIGDTRLISWTKKASLGSWGRGAAKDAENDRIFWRGKLPESGMNLKLGGGIPLSIPKPFFREKSFGTFADSRRVPLLEPCCRVQKLPGTDKALVSVCKGGELLDCILFG